MTGPDQAIFQIGEMIDLGSMLRLAHGSANSLAAGDYQEWRIRSLNILKATFGVASLEYLEFFKQVGVIPYPINAENGMGILRAAKADIEAGFGFPTDSDSYGPREHMEMTQIAGESEPNQADPRKVFVVHGRDERIRRGIFSFLRALRLEPIEWAEAVQMTGTGTPYVGEVLDVAFAKAQAIVIVMTPDDEGKLRDEFVTEHDSEYERMLTPQARQNVVFETGLALGREPKRTIIVEIGNLRPFSDIIGRHTVRLNNSPEAKHALAERLKTAECEVDTSGTDWLTEGDFEADAGAATAVVPAEAQILVKVPGPPEARMEQLDIVGSMRHGASHRWVVSVPYEVRATRSTHMDKLQLVVGKEHFDELHPFSGPLSQAGAVSGDAIFHLPIDLPVNSYQVMLVACSEGKEWGSNEFGLELRP